MLLHILFISPYQLLTDKAVPTKNHNVIIDSKYKSPQLKMENSLFTLSPEILTHIDKIVEVPHNIEDTIKAIQNLGNELKHGRDTFLVFFTDELKKHTEHKYFVSSDKEMAKRVCGFFPALYAYNAYDKIEYKLPLTDNAAEIATSPLFDELTSELLVKFDETKLPKFYLFYDKIEQLEGFREIVYKHRNDVKIGHLEFKKEGSLKHVGINDTDMPAIVTIVEGAKYSEKLLDAQKLDDFLTSFVNKTIKPFELSEEVIEDSDEVLKQNKISRKMYKTGDYKHSLLFFVSKNCGHCKNLKPVIKELIKENRSKVKVCVVDATKNDFSEFVIRGYPTIAYAEDGNIKYFEGERSVAKFVDFVKKNSKDGIDMLSEEEGHADL